MLLDAYGEGGIKKGKSKIGMVYYAGFMREYQVIYASDTSRFYSTYEDLPETVTRNKLTVVPFYGQERR